MTDEQRYIKERGTPSRQLKGIPRDRRAEMISLLISHEVDRLTPEQILGRVRGSIRERYTFMADEYLQEKYDKIIKEQRPEDWTKT